MKSEIKVAMLQTANGLLWSASDALSKEIKEQLNDTGTGLNADTIKSMDAAIENFVAARNEAAQALDWPELGTVSVTIAEASETA
jgi:hypothetical protein